MRPFTTGSKAGFTLAAAAALALWLGGCGPSGAYSGANAGGAGATAAMAPGGAPAGNQKVQGGPIAPKPDKAVTAAASPEQDNPRTLVLAGGCFWCVEAVFEHTKGVDDVVSGFSGGKKATAQYDRVSAGGTNHAESVRITYDPHKVSLGQLLRVYFTTIFPTQRGGQGPDMGRQYRAEIFYADPAQKAAAQAYIQQLRKAGIYHGELAVQLGMFTGFYPAVEYHQDYVKKNPRALYVRANSIPKLAKYKQGLPNLYRDTWGGGG